MDSEDRIERIFDIYVSAEAVRDMEHKKETEDFNTEEPRTPRHTGSDGVTISRAAGVCLGLMFVVLTTAVIVLCVSFTNLTKERDQLKSEINDLQKCLPDGWKCHQSSLYYFSYEMKNWDESRRYCRERGTDLIIINNGQEHDFVKNICGSDHFWIGLTDVEVEGRWKWVDGSTLTYRFWASGEPNNYQGNEDCAVIDSSEWFDTKCDNRAKWICEKKYA
ncbi:CD209 antigen-like protein C isoform X2 [Carassius gibelio]|uniref:CD209 antigen-like protein C isoform X2 n=1 Tax=Carassius gibelio TaxID=101364 RepID=UPI00227937D6|nr:CD209 antigen-like protein C isoform X2 [Carassius gibelio]